ncbi:MAG TPA: hypothetical protein PKH19_05190 [Candidatus Syntrophosphaera sp.]|nr:hypothetical protein [Candidatus Syntrophosphaera sp.]
MLCVHDGDPTGDGLITPADAQLAFFYYLDCANQAPTEEQYCAADLCGAGSAAPCDGSVTPADALGLFKTYLSLPNPCQ